MKYHIIALFQDTPGVYPALEENEAHAEAYQKSIDSNLCLVVEAETPARTVSIFYRGLRYDLNEAAKYER